MIVYIGLYNEKSRRFCTSCAERISMTAGVEDSKIAQVKSFIEEKRKRKEPSKKDADEFEQLWLASVEETGLDKESFALLCDGFRYATARPLFKYFKLKDASKQPYAALGTYEPIRKNPNELELRFYMSLLAFELMDPTSADQIAALLKKIPDAALTKDNKITGNLSAFVRRLILSELAAGVIKADATEIKMLSKDASRFVKLIGPVVSEAVENDKLKASERDAAKGLRAWLDALYEPEKKAKPAVEAIAAFELTDAPSEIVNNPVQNETQPDGDDLINVDQIVQAVKGLGTTLKDRGRKIESLRSTIASGESEISRLKDHRDSLKDQNAEFQAKLDKSRETIAELNAEVMSLKQQIERLSADLSANRQMVELLEQTGSKQSDETIKRISRKLKIEFEDYQDAVGLDMDADLGENMRLQLGSVFQILKENGFEL